MLLRFSLIVILALSLLGCNGRTVPPPGSKLVTVTENSDKSQVFYFRNNASCLKRADHTRFINTKGSIEIKEVFTMSGSYEDKMEKAKQLSPQFQELEASFFDICYEYGEERSAKAQYDENRRIYQGIRQRLLDPKLSPPMSAAPSAPATPAPIASTIKPVPKRVAGIILYVDTNKNNKDREIMFNYSIHRISDGAKIAGIGAGGGEVWPRPSLRHFKIPIDTNNRFAYADRGGYRLHIQYECWSGDPNWIGRVRADAEVEGGEIIPILSETDDFEMGHHDDGKQRERINRDFDFNK